MIDRNAFGHIPSAWQSKEFELGALAADGTAFIITAANDQVQLIEISKGGFAADSWYGDLQSAMLDAYETLGVTSNDWHFIPPGTDDPVSYLLKSVSMNSSAA